MNKIINSYFVGFLVSLVMVIIVSIFLTILINSHDLNTDTNYDTYFFVAKAIIYLISSIFVGIKIGKVGMLNGLIFGILISFIYFIIILLAFNTRNINTFNTLISILLSTFGGIIGVNLKNK